MITVWLDPNNWKKEKLPEKTKPAEKDRIYQSLLIHYVRKHIPFDEVEYRDIPEFIDSSINGWNDSSHNICIIRSANSQSLIDIFERYADIIRWCNNNDITFAIDCAFEILDSMLTKKPNSNQSVSALEWMNLISTKVSAIPNKFKIFTNQPPENNDILKKNINAVWDDYIVHTDYFKYYCGAFLGYRNIVPPQVENKYLFSSFIGEVGRYKPHRTKALAGFKREGLDKNAFLSWFSRDELLYHEDNDNIWEGRSETFTWPNSEDDIRQVLSKVAFEGNNIAREDKRIPMAMFESHFNIVMESYTVNEIASWTEKTYKPIACQKPFIIISSNNINKLLTKTWTHKNLGQPDFDPNVWQIFDEIFDYSFEDTYDEDEYVENFIKEILRVSKEPASIWTQPNVIEKTKYNYNKLVNDTTPQKIKEHVIDVLTSDRNYKEFL